MAEFNISSVKTTDPGDIYGILCVGVDNTGTLLDPIAFTTSFTETDPVFTASPAAGVTSQKITNWDTAFGWGNHASAGYLLSATAANTYQPIDDDLTAIGGLSGTSGILRKTAANTWALDTNTYLTSFTETDPVFTASPAFGVTSQKITNWDTAFGWGNHASAGYQSALGFTPLNRAGDSISATNGSGFIGYPSQSGTPSTPSSGFRFYANASHALSWVGQNGFTRTFDGTANTANRAYTLPNASGTIALTSDLSSYFPVAGGSLTGTGGSGFYGAIPQSSAPSTPASGFRLYANSAGLLEWKGTNGFTRTFDGAANTADRAYTLPNSSGTIALEGTLTSLANPTIQNGVYQFAQNTKPTQRAVGVSLVAGDRWYKTDDGTEWFWNGTYWASLTILETSFKREIVGSPYGNFYDIIASRNSVFVETIIVVHLVATSDVNNYWSVSFSLQPIGTGGQRPALITFVPQSSTFSIDQIFTVKQAVSSNSPGAAVAQAGLCFHGNYARTGSPSGLTIAASLTYRHIYP